MSNEAKGPYRTGYERGYHTVIDGSGVVVYSDDTSAGVNMFADAANYAHHHALTSQAARVKELEEALRLVREEARAWREEWRLYNMRGGGFMRPFIYEMNTDANDCLNTPALTPKEPQQ